MTVIASNVRIKRQLGQMAHLGLVSADGIGQDGVVCSDLVDVDILGGTRVVPCNLDLLKRGV